MRLFAIGRQLGKRLGGLQSTRLSHGNEPAHFNPGPPTTYDSIPIPFQPYGKVHQKLQRKFNRYLLVSIGLLVTSFALAIADDLFLWDGTHAPHSWKNRNKKA
ncbi:hypothetical protein AB6A40_007800 [Gnathostoma spinigerum]|uniref:Deltamethrin resistance protein prag01 domain-containing protein n=1 Tax=Gnathostoma spinigerum TaxID=75299 RepID=A0ABD6EPA1_9BILA